MLQLQTLIGKLVALLQLPTLIGSTSAGGRGASVSACADLTNQLQCCWVDPACAWIKTLTWQL